MSSLFGTRHIDRTEPHGSVMEWIEQSNQQKAQQELLEKQKAEQEQPNNELQLQFAQTVLQTYTKFLTIIFITVPLTIALCILISKL